MSSSDPSSSDTATRASGDFRASQSPGQQGADTLSPSNSELAPGLYIVSTPIGNLRDITLRALDVLGAADEVLTEDTRVAGKLLSTYGITTKTSPYHDHNGAERRPAILKKLSAGGRIALISDAGTPLVSDPGLKLARDAIEMGVPVIPIPGASAMLSALVTSGLPSDQFLFAGFLPAKSGQRRAKLGTIGDTPATLIFYESGHRLVAMLADLCTVLGTNRHAVVARELTKLFEETRRGSLGELATHYNEAGPPKGEIVVLVGPPLAREVSDAEIDTALRAALADHPTKAAANAVADALGLAKRDVYQRALQLKSHDAR